MTALKLFLPLECCLIHEGSIVVFLTGAAFESVCLLGQDKFRRFLDNNSLRSAVSNAFTDIMDSPYNYQVTKKTLEVAKMYKISFAIFNDIKYYIVANLINLNYRINDFLHPGILKLLNYDNENNTELTSTLVAYIYEKNNIDAVSQKLHIHRSTLFYRIRKIKELTNINFEQINDLSLLYFSCKVLEVIDQNEIFFSIQ
jgi:DNA-binding PucR family transcriptional regulator